MGLRGEGEGEGNNRAGGSALALKAGSTAPRGEETQEQEVKLKEKKHRNVDRTGRPLTMETGSARDAAEGGEKMAEPNQKWRAGCGVKGEAAP